jgi:hypothetical protein
MAVRLGSADLLNTMVVAHPASVTQAQIRAIKVTSFIVFRLMVSLTSPNLDSHILGFG